MKISSIKRPAAQAIVLAASAAAVLASGPARAGDELYGWRGFYVGASATYGFINQDIKFISPSVASGSADLNGFGVTGLVGYRIPVWTERYRLGVEFDGTVGDNGGAFNKYRFVSDFLATARGTFGLHVRPDLLWFGTAGVGWMGINSQTTAVATATTITGTSSALADRRSSKTVVGGVVGTGLEWDMGRAWHLRGEYLYGSFENHRADTSVADKTISTDAHQIRLGIVVSLQNPYDEPHGRGGDIDADRYGRGGPMK